MSWKRAASSIPRTRAGCQPSAVASSRVMEATRRECPSRPGPLASALPIIVPRMTCRECDSDSRARRRWSRSSARLTRAAAVSVRSRASSAASVTERRAASGEPCSTRSGPRGIRRPRIEDVTRTIRSSLVHGWVNRSVTPTASAGVTSMEASRLATPSTGTVVGPSPRRPSTAAHVRISSIGTTTRAGHWASTLRCASISSLTSAQASPASWRASRAQGPIPFVASRTSTWAGKQTLPGRGGPHRARSLRGPEPEASAARCYGLPPRSSHAPNW